MNANVVINQRSNGTWSLVIDGKDIADSVTGCFIRIDGADRPAQVTLELMDVAAMTGEAEIVVDRDLAGILERLGWTPPHD